MSFFYIGMDEPYSQAVSDIHVFKLSYLNPRS